MNYSPLRNICYPRKGRRMRSSSYDRTGGNEDYIRIKPNEAKVIMEEDRPGCITHIWMTGAPLINMFKTEHLPRKVVIRMFWDNEETPSVEVPLGDFFGIGHGVVKNFVSLPFQMSPQDGAAFNCWLPMPFESGARIEIENQSEIEIKIYYYVDYEQYDASDTPLRFHACFRREITVGIDESKVSTAFFHHGGVNLTGEGNYVILEVIAGGSLAKAFCAYGAIALGSQECIDAMWQSPPARGAAGGMTAAAAMSAAALNYAAEHPELLAKLRHIIAYIKGKMNAMGIAVGESESPNVTFSLGTPAEMRRIQQALLEEGIYIMYSNYIGAPAGGVLRLSLFADHTEADIDRFLAALQRQMP